MKTNQDYVVESCGRSARLILVTCALQVESTRFRRVFGDFRLKLECNWWIIRRVKLFGEVCLDRWMLNGDGLLECGGNSLKDRLQLLRLIQLHAF